MDKSEIDGLAEKFGGRFRLTVLIQKRLKELTKGAGKLVPSESRNLIDVVLEEIRQGKVVFDQPVDEEELKAEEAKARKRKAEEREEKEE